MLQLHNERERADTQSVARKKPVRIIVRRGALRRFDALVSKTSELPVEVSWDRRKEDRRASSEAAPVERRSNERRKKPPFTWDLADFVVVDSARELEAPAGQRPARTQKSKKTKKTA
jgi:hypothetical protein